MNTYIRFIIRFRWAVLALLALVTAAAAWNMTRGVFASSIGRMILSEHPGYQSYLERQAEFGNNDVIVAALEEPDILAPDVQERLRTISRSIERYAPDCKVRTVLDIQHIDGEGEDLVVHKYSDEARRNPDNRARIKEALLSDPFAKGLFVSADGLSTAIVVELNTVEDRPAEKGPPLIAEIIETFERAGFDKDMLHVVGVPATVATTVEETQFNVKRLFPLVCLVLLFTVWIMFRRFWPVAVSMAVALIAVVWTMGFAVLLDRQVSILTSMVPGIILIISFSDVIHLCSAYLLELGRGLSRREAILAAGSDVGTACVLTSVTTFAGFVSLSLVPTPVFRTLGITLAFGVSVSLLIAITLVPIMWSLMRRPKPWKQGTTGRVQEFLDDFLEAVSRFSVRRAPWIIAGFAVLALAAAWGATSARIETDMARRMDEDHRLRVDGDWFRSNYSGSNMMDLFIEAPEGKDLLEPGTFAAIAELQDTVVALADVDQAYSMVDLMEIIHREFGGGGGKEDRLPTSRQALAQYLLLFEMAGGEDLDRLVDFDRRNLRMTIHIPGEGVVHTRDTGKEIEGLARQALGDRASAEVTGLAYLMGDWIEAIVQGQKNGLALAVFLITLMMIIGLRSWKVGLWSMIPNLLPLLVLGGYLGIFWGDVDSDLLGLAMIAIGIGVDDTVHFLMRFRIESLRSPDTAEAIRRTFHFSGRGIVTTTVILVAGFMPFALSSYLSLAVMGTLLPMTLIVALAGDILLVPALVKVGWVRFNWGDRVPTGRPGA
ncbi:MAG: MMPL family transporter [Deltaproteobacteria bacterium]|nr:MMPL family transporter [Deltaproteobacteria bacterium]